MTDASIVPEPEPTEHRVAYHRELEELRADIVRLGSMADEMIPQGTEVLLSGELSLAQKLIDRDDDVDRLSIEIEERCYAVMVRQSPIAGELRQLITITKMVAEIERSADLMVNVTKAARRMYGATLTPKIRGVIASMAKEAQRLLRLSIDAFSDGNDALAGALDDIDDQLDQLNRDMVEAIFESQAEGQIDIAAAVQLALIARYYERIGDHAVNIGTRVIYMVTGWLPAHTGAIRSKNRSDEPELAAHSRTDRVVGDVALDAARHEVTVRGDRVSLPLKEFDLLALLMENAGHVMTRDMLIDRVWGHDYVGDTKTLDVHIKRVREKIEVDSSNPARIVTIRGLGYKMVLPEVRAKTKEI